MNKMSIDDARSIATEQELMEGVFRIGSKYAIRTPTFHYEGVLTAVTPMVYVFKDHSTVFDSGRFVDYFNGNPQDASPHTGSEELIIDRAGAVLIRFRDKK